MPCNSDHMRPTSKEIRSRDMAQHLCYVRQALELPWTAEERAASKDCYGARSLCDIFAERLCTMIRSMDTPTQDKIIYNGHCKQARAVADWWDEHKEHDCKQGRH